MIIEKLCIGMGEISRHCLCTGQGEDLVRQDTTLGRLSAHSSVLSLMLGQMIIKKNEEENKNE